MDILPEFTQRGLFEHLGTRFLVYPQPAFIAGYEKPEVVWLSTPAGAVSSGPSDRRVYVVDPLLPKQPYEAPYLPPFVGDAHPPAEPGPDGHFDHISPGSKAFISTHAFACVRRVMDVCESYLGREIPWFFDESYERLELIPHLMWDNAQAGYGYLELGEDDTRGEPHPFALNFDAVAHEVGHLMLLGSLGLPKFSVPSNDFLSYHEAVADFTSLVCLLQFETATDHILRRTRGNLLIANELDRLAELSDEKQVRALSHSLRLRDVGSEVHDRSRPFSGALLDCLIEIYQLILVERNLASLDTRNFQEVRRDVSPVGFAEEEKWLQESYYYSHFMIKSALEEARDIVGEGLFKSFDFLNPDNLSFSEASEAFIDAISRGRGSRFLQQVYLNFAWRELI